MATQKPQKDDGDLSIAHRVATGRDTSRDNALVLRATSHGTPGSRTVAFVDYCVNTPLDAVTPENVVSYAATRAFVEGAWRLRLRSTDRGEGLKALPASCQPPTTSHHADTNFAQQAQWHQVAATAANLATRLINAKSAADLTRAPHRSVLLSQSPAFSHALSARERARLLLAASHRMGLTDVPIIALLDLQRHGYFADRGVFDGEDESNDFGDPRRRMSSGSYSRGGSELSASFGTGLSGLTNDANKRAKPKTSLRHLNINAEREKRLAGTDVTSGDMGSDIKGAAVFEWSRSQKGRPDKPAFPQASEETWISIKGIVFNADPRRVADPGRRLYYTMVLIPLFSGRDITNEIAAMAPGAQAESGDGDDDAAAELDDPFGAGMLDDDADELSGEPWCSIAGAEDDCGLGESAAALVTQRLAYPERYSLRASMSRAQRTHVDAVFAMLHEDFDIIGTLDDQSRELWL